MAFVSDLGRLFRHTAADEDPEPSQRSDQRKASLRCRGCDSWNRSRLVYMSNGGDYCLGCARHIARTHGYTVAGKRWTDITSLG